MTFSDEAKAELAKPLDKRNVKPPAPGKYGEYVEGWHVIAEANRIFGFDGWTRETVSMIESNREIVELTGKNGPYKQWRVGFVAKVRITAGGIIREGTGFGSGMSKPDAIGEAIESAVKEAETDAMKRGLMTFGYPFGLALYDKTKANVADAPPPPSNFETLAKAVEASANVDQLKATFDAIKADKSLTKDEGERLVALKDTRKVALTTKDPKTSLDAIDQSLGAVQ